MSKTMFVGIACVVTIALGVIPAATAPAATPGWMVNGSLVTSTKATSTTSTVTRVVQMLGGAIRTECIAKTASWAIGAGIKVFHWFQGRLKLGECGVLEPPSCTMPETLETVPLLAEATLDGTLGISLEVLPQTKTVLATIHFEGASCAFQGTQPLLGKIRFLDPLGQMEETVQEMEIKTIEGDLKIGSSGAELTGALQLQLASGETWSFL